MRTLEDLVKGGEGPLEGLLGGVLLLRSRRGPRAEGSEHSGCDLARGIRRRAAARLLEAGASGLRHGQPACIPRTSTQKGVTPMPPPPHRTRRAWRWRKTNRHTKPQRNRSERAVPASRWVHTLPRERVGGGGKVCRTFLSYGQMLRSGYTHERSGASTSLLLKSIQASTWPCKFEKKDDKRNAGGSVHSQRHGI